MDFIVDGLATGRMVRILSVIVNSLKSPHYGIELSCAGHPGRDSRVTNQKQLEEMVERRPGSRLAILRGGHVAHLDDPEGFTTTVRRFLAELPLRRSLDTPCTHNPVVPIRDSWQGKLLIENRPPSISPHKRRGLHDFLSVRAAVKTAAGAAAAAQSDGSKVRFVGKAHLTGLGRGSRDPLRIM